MNRLLPAFLLSVSAAFMLSSCNKTKITQSPVETALDSIFTSMFAPDEPGAIVLVAKGDSIIYDKGFGLADIEKHRPMSDTTLVNICSISKQFSAMALLLLEERGALSLNDTLPKYFPEFKAPFFKDITLRHLLSHTSGIPDTRPRTETEWKKYLENHTSRFGSVHDYKLYAPTVESIEYLTTLDSLAFTPGTAYEYQNPTFQLAKPIVEIVTGQEFAAWMKQNIFIPAGMHRTFFFDPSREMPQGMAHAYIPAQGDNKYNYFRSKDGKWEESDYGEAYFFPTQADGGIYTTAKEFLNWEKALFGNKIITKESLAKATEPIIETDIPETSYGLGLFIEQKPGMPRKVFHTGDNGGFFTFECYFPEHDLFYLVFANRNDWSREKTMEQMDSIFNTAGLLR